jgi:hypothetical protein
MNPYKFQIVEYYKDYPYGTPNRIVASAATLKGCISQYNKHLKTFKLAKIDHKPIKTDFLCDGVSFNVINLGV